MLTGFQELRLADSVPLAQEKPKGEGIGRELGGFIPLLLKRGE